MSIRLVIGFFDNGKRSDFALKQEFSVQRGDLFLSMMDKMTVRPKTFGDVAAPLDEV